VSYGLRDGENMDGSDRPDFLSAGVNVQIPLFSDAKQRQNQNAAKTRSMASQIQRDEALSQMRFEVDNLIQQYRNTAEQRALYETDILPTLEKQRKSALQSYESDQGNFRLVMSLFLKEQGAKTMHQRLRVNEQKLISSLNYLLGLDSTEAKNGAL
jgi:outer membrane protein TolC